MNRDLAQRPPRSLSLSSAAPRRQQMTPRDLWQVARGTLDAWMDDRASSMGAALAYYTLFSLAPLLLMAIAVAGAVFGVEAARGEIFVQLHGLLGDAGANAVADLLKSVQRHDQAGLGTWIGAALLLVGATTVFAELQTSLDFIWRVPAKAAPSGLWSWLRRRWLSLGLMLGVGFLLMVSLAVSAALAACGRWWAPAFGGWQSTLQAANNGLGFAITTAMFALIYKLMPSARIAWPDVWLGSAVTALLFTLGKALIGWYIGTSGVASGFGAASSVVALLVWVYWSAQVFLVGAEFTWVFAHRCGSRRASDAAQASGGAT